MKKIKFKNIFKGFKLKAIFTAIIFMILIIDLNPFGLRAGRENLTYKAQAYRRAIWDTKNQEYHGFALATVGGNQAYCMDYGLKNPSSGVTMHYMTSYDSNKLNAILNYGYPNKTPAQLGVGANDADSAYLGTQLAIWVAMNGKTEGKVIDLNSLQPNVNPANNGKSQYKAVLENAKKIANKILASATYAPSFTVTGNNKIDYTTYGDKIKAGPFKVNVKDYECNKYNVSLSGSVPTGTQIVDVNNNVKTSFNKGEDIYVLVNKNVNPTKVTVNVSATVNQMLAVVYGNGSKGYQRFIYPSIEQKAVNASTDFTWEKQEGNFTLNKVDQDGNKVAGVTFELFNSKNESLGEKVTDANGKLTYTNLPVGNYTLREKKVPDGYVMPKNPDNKVTITTNKTTTLDIQNYKIKGGLEIIKQAKDTKTPVEGAVFQVYEDKNGEAYAYEQIVSGPDGKAATKKEYTVGKYYFKEISAPDGYIKDNNLYDFYISANNLIQKATVTNDRITGKLEITKVDNNNDKVAGAKFAIINTKTGETVDAITTDKDGKATSTLLLKGNYIFKEIEVPDGYVLDTTERPFSITEINQVVKENVKNTKIEGKLQITKFDDTRLNIKGVKFNILASDKKTVLQTLVTDENGMAESKILSKGTYYYQEIEVPDGYKMDEEPLEFKIDSAGQVVKKEVVNERIKGNVEIYKVDEDTNLPIEGVVFNILDKDKKLVQTITTNKDGIAKVENLLKGKYYYKEVSAPDIYKYDTKEVAFEISKMGDVFKKTITNKRIVGTIQLTKIDDAGKPIKGAVFEILNEKNEVIDTITTNDEGIATSKKPLDKGIYRYREISVPDGYIMDSSEYKFEIKNSGQIVKQKVKNDRVTGYIEIRKVDEANTPIKGVKFEILDENKKVIDTITTDSDGIAISKGLYIGKYTYREIKTPDKYVLDKNEYPFEVTSKKNQVVVTVVNKLSTGILKIVKIDKDTKETIEGVTFQILDENYKVVDTIVTDFDGVARSKSLVLGKYYYKEISAPDNYIVNPKEADFKLTKDAEILEKKVTNEPKKLPVTGGFISTDVLLVIVVTALSITAFVVFKIVKNRRDNPYNPDDFYTSETIYPIEPQQPEQTKSIDDCIKEDVNTENIQEDINSNKEEISNEITNESNQEFEKLEERINENNIDSNEDIEIDLGDEDESIITNNDNQDNFDD